MEVLSHHGHLIWFNMKSIPLTRSKVTASITSLWINVQLFAGGCRVVKLDSRYDPQERHVYSITNPPVRIAAIGVRTLVGTETRLRVAFMFSYSKLRDKK